MADVVWTLPVASSGLTSPEFRVQPKRRCVLVFNVERADGGFGDLVLAFEGIEAFRCTYFNARDEAMAEAYDRVLDCGRTKWLLGIQRNLLDRGDAPADLKHLMLDLDDGPCYEFICRAFHVENA